MKKLFLIISLLLSVTLFISCEKDSDDDSGNVDVEDSVSHESSDDYVWDESSVTTITLAGTAITTGSALVTITGSIATITAAGTYRITGSLTNGQIVVNAGDTDLVRLILNGTSITNSTGSALLVENSLKTIINLADGTQNTITDGSGYALPAEDPNAAIFSKSDLTIFGTGSLTVKGNYNDGISSKDGLLLKSGNIAVTAVDDGIRGKDYLIAKGGTITINSGGDGLKSDSEDGSAVGYISINAGIFKITSTGDAVSAQTDVAISGGEFTLLSGGGSSQTAASGMSAKGIKGLLNVTLAAGTFSINSADDAIHSNNNIVINSGTYTLASADDAIHADANLTVNAGEIAVTKCYEGFESHNITINDGSISIVSSDDSFNASSGNGSEQNDGSYIYINGGHIVLNGSAGDPLDSNGNIVMKAGTVIVHGPSSQPEVAIDYNGTFNISGGRLVASGSSSNMTQAPGTASTQNSLKLMFSSSLAASTIFHVQDAAGNDICSFKPVRKYQSIIFSSPKLVKGSTYYIYKAGTSTGTDDNGLLTGGIYTPGTQVTSFTISGTVTTKSGI